MEEHALQHAHIVGREEELGKLKQHLSDAVFGKGSTVLISGEPGIGKTRLVEEFRKHAEAEGVRILSGAAMSGSAHPFQVFSKALEGITTEPLFEESEYTSFNEIFAVNSAGLLLAKASSEEGGLDADIFAGMLSAVQDFVRDSFGGEGKAGLGRLEYGDMKILIEHGPHLFLTAVFTGNEHPDMKNTLKQMLRRVGENHGNLLENWTGSMDDIKPVQDEITRATAAKFLVRKDLEGVKLETERTRIANRVLENIIQASNENPLMLLLEDLHWSDDSSLFVLKYIARNIAKARIIILLTARLSEGDGIQKTISNMLDEGSLTELRLEGLDMSGVHELVNAAFPNNCFPADFFQKLHQDCAGNPFFISELLQQMFEDKAIAIVGEKYTLSRDDYAMPSSIGEIISQRLASLDPEALALAEYASCVGREFALDYVSSVNTGNNTDETLRRLQDSGVILLHRDRGEFRHALFQSAIYSEISPRWRGIHHKGLGEYLERVHADELGNYTYELARHFSQTIEHSKAYNYCIKAGEKAEYAYAAEQAASYYGYALASLSNIKDAQKDARGALLERLGEAQLMAGQYEKALESYGKALEAFPDPLSKARLYRKRSSARERLSDFPGAVEEAVQGEALVGPDELEYWRLMAQKGGVGLRLGDFDGVIKVYEMILPRFNEFEGTKKDIARAYSALGFSFIRKGQHEKAIECLRQAKSIMNETGDEWGMANTYNNIGILHYNRGEIDEAWDAYASSLKIYEERKDQGGISLLYNNMSLLLSARGDLEGGLEMLSKSLAIRKKLGDQTGIAMCLVNIGEMQGDLGERERALDCYRRNLEIVEKLGDRRGTALACSNIANEMRAMGDLSAAEEWYARSIETSRANDIKDYLVEGMLGLAQVRICQGRLNESERLCAESEGAIKDAGYRIHHAYRLRVLGLLLSAKGDAAGAEAAFDESIKAYREVNATTDIPKAQTEMGTMLAANGQEERGRALLTEALREFEARGMKAWVERCRKALEELEQ